MKPARAGALIALALLGCRDRAPRPAADPPRDAAPPRTAEALALIEKYECARCHDGTEATAVPLEKHCVHCHRAIRDGTFEADPMDVMRWREHLHSMLVVPSLAHAGRLRRAWVADFLQHPVDVRPSLMASMPRLALSAADAAILAEYLVPDDRGEAVHGGDVAAGARVFVARGCPSCHAISGAALPEGTPATPRDQLNDAIALAPDLALARVRLQPDRVVAWILDPAAVVPGTLMPRLGLSPTEARDVAAFVLLAPLAAPAAPPPEERLPVMTREVTFDEVSERVFQMVCWHCHSQPDYAIGDGGPGNTGGFGFAPRGLDLSSYEGVSSGSRGDDGRRRSLFARLPDGTPRLIAHLMARRREERGEVGPLRGMPLGLPALSLVEIQIVESWIVQGRPE